MRNTDRVCARTNANKTRLLCCHPAYLPWEVHKRLVKSRIRAKIFHLRARQRMAKVLLVRDIRLKKQETVETVSFSSERFGMCLFLFILIDNINCTPTNEYVNRDKNGMVQQHDEKNDDVGDRGETNTPYISRV